MATYKVTLPRTFAYVQRTRAGGTVTREHGYEGDLSDGQIKVIKADPESTLVKTRSSGAVDEPVEQPADTPSDTWTRKNFDAYALEHGVGAPEKLDRKQRVLEAIEAASRK